LQAIQSCESGCEFNWHKSQSGLFISITTTFYLLTTDQKVVDSISAGRATEKPLTLMVGGFYIFPQLVLNCLIKLKKVVKSSEEVVKKESLFELFFIY